jgi:AmmeMemoRadiSam system protein B
MIRQPAVAGQFYPGSAPELKKMIGSMVREGKEKEEAIGMVLPHAGYI